VPALQSDRPGPAPPIPGPGETSPGPVAVGQAQTSRDHFSNVAGSERTQLVWEWSEEPRMTDTPTQFGAVRTIEPRFRRVLRRAQHYASSPLPLLLLGESGTGKEVLARAVHEASAARGGPFVAVNCGGIQASLLESELFGHAKGAFTGALQDRPGALRAAHGGTLFLDELGDAPMNLQTALLRALETQRIRPVGSERECIICVRIMAATSRPLYELMRAGAFRADLYHRLSGATLELPALRERLCDLPLIAEDLLGALRPRTTVSGGALALLAERAFPGNIRQLRNTLGRALADAAPLPGSACEIQPDDIAPESECDRELSRMVLEGASGRELGASGPAGGSALHGTPSNVHTKMYVHGGVPGGEALGAASPRNERSFVSRVGVGRVAIPPGVVEGLGHLRGAAEAYLRSELLIVPVGLTRRGARAYERALLLLIADAHAEEWAWLPAWVQDRWRRLFREGWEKADGGQAGRGLGRV